MTLTDQTGQTRGLERPHPVLVACWAAGYGPWQMLAPALAAVAEACRGQVTVAILAIEALPQTPQRAGMQPLPPVRCWQDGPVVDARIGVVDGADMAVTRHALTGASQA